MSGGAEFKLVMVTQALRPNGPLRPAPNLLAEARKIEKRNGALKITSLRRDGLAHLSALYWEVLEETWGGNTGGSSRFLLGDFKAG